MVVPTMDVTPQRTRSSHTYPTFKQKAEMASSSIKLKISNCLNATPNCWCRAPLFGYFQYDNESRTEHNFGILRNCSGVSSSRCSRQTAISNNGKLLASMVGWTGNATLCRSKIIGRNGGIVVAIALLQIILLTREQFALVAEVTENIEFDGVLGAMWLLSPSVDSSNSEVGKSRRIATRRWNERSLQQTNNPSLPILSTDAGKLASTRVLVAQYNVASPLKSDRDKDSLDYSILLNLTQPINELYAKRWGYDYFVLRGWPHDEESTEKRDQEYTTSLPPSRATYLKVYLLQRALNLGYDFLVLLDADAVIYDFNHSMIDLVASRNTTTDEAPLLAAHAVYPHSSTRVLSRKEKGVTSRKLQTSDLQGRYHRRRKNDCANINIGVTVWNLRHSLASSIAQQWQDACYHRIRRREEQLQEAKMNHRKLDDSSIASDNDQVPLQQVLRRQQQWDAATAANASTQTLMGRRGSTAMKTCLVKHAPPEALRYGRGTIIKHFIGRQQRSMYQYDFDRRIRGLVNVWKSICPLYQLDCPPLPLEIR